MINLYTTSTIGNYKTGTVTCTKNSPTVTGTGTTWKEIVNPGDILTLDDDKFYIISAVNSNTSLTLDKNFAENTATNVSYRILLNTAAHFPSDTAAKVERALEQLSDINEAAINNDRTVTAATKVNGKGLSSTMGDIHLNPASVNTNRGGTINFHYNQNSSSTSSIYEDASGRIKLQGDVNVTGSFNGGLKETQTGITRGANTSGTTTNALLIEYDSNSNINSQISRSFRYISANDYANFIGIQVFNPTNTTASSVGQLGIGYKNGEMYTAAPTPATTDNSTQIATTAFVNSFFNNNIKNYLVRGYYLGTANQNPVTFTTIRAFLVFATRGNNAQVVMCSTWDSPITLLTVGTNIMSVTKDGNTVTITNTSGSAIDVIVVSGGMNWY